MTHLSWSQLYCTQKEAGAEQPSTAAEKKTLIRLQIIDALYEILTLPDSELTRSTVQHQIVNNEHNFIKANTRIDTGKKKPYKPSFL